MSEEFPILLIEPDADRAAEYRTKRENDRVACEGRYRTYLAGELTKAYPDLPGADAITEFVLQTLFRWPRRSGEDDCVCSCHPRLPDSDFHDYGFDCSCTWDEEERQKRNRAWQESLQEWWDSPEYKEMAKRRDAEEAALKQWLADHSSVTVSRHGGCAPEQWEGEVDGHSFYFRERHGDWRIEIDLEPTGRYFKTFSGKDDDGEIIYGQEAITEGTTIAEGSICTSGYGENPVERIQFIARTIRDHFRRLACPYCNGTEESAV